jgi:hypothetical protein
MCLFAGDADFFRISVIKSLDPHFGLIRIARRDEQERGNASNRV